MLTLRAMMKFGFWEIYKMEDSPFMYFLVINIRLRPNKERLYLLFNKFYVWSVAP